MLKKNFTFDELRETLLSRILNESKARRICEYIEDLDVADEHGETLLFELIRKNRLESIKILIEHNITLDIENKDGITPLTESITHNRKKIFELLIHSNVNINYKNRFKRTAIQEAALGGLYWAVRELMPKTKDINNRDIYGRTVLFDAIASGSYNTLDILLGNENLDVNVIDYSGKAAIFNAVILSDMDLVEKLMNRGVDLNIRDSAGKNVLFYAVTKGVKNSTIINRLVNTGLDINTKDNSQQTVLFEIMKVLMALKQDSDAINQKRNELYQLADTLFGQGLSIDIEDKNGKTALFYAVHNKDEESIKFLVKSGADINKKDSKGETALFEAALLGYGYKAVIDTLIENGAEINIRNNSGKTIIEVLVDIILMLENGKIVDDLRLSICTHEGEYSQLLRHILDNDKAKIALRDDIGEPLFFEIIKSGNNQLKLLFLHKVDINILDSEGRNLLAKSIDEISSAPAAEELEFFKYLIRSGVKVNLVDNKGQTVLHKAVSKGIFELVKFLIDYAKADISIKDDNGRTALHLVRGRSSETIMNLLLRNGIRFINDSDKFGYTPINYAALSGDHKTVQCLIAHDAFLTNFNKKNKVVTKKLYEHINVLDNLVDKCDERYKSQIESLTNNMKQEMVTALG
jgi:ankyrin repeat protein